MGLTPGLMCMQLDVRELSSGKILYRGPVGGTVNNALHISKDASGRQGCPRSRVGRTHYRSVSTQQKVLLLVTLR